MSYDSYARRFALAILLSVVLLFSAACGTISPTTGPQSDVTPTPKPETATPTTGTVLQRTIVVVGEGRAKAKPDLAILNLGVQTVGVSVKEAIDDNDSVMTAILDALKTLEIEEKDVQTSNYSIWMERAPGEEGEYRVSNMVQVTIRKLDQVGTVLEKVVEAGANNVYGINFSVSDPKALQAEARAAAVADAKARAMELAELSGVSLGEVIGLSEVIGGPGPGPILLGGGGGGAPIEPGELEFTFQVQVTYAIE